MREGFGGDIGWGRSPALVVIDVTNGFTDPTHVLGCDMDEVVAVNARLIAAARTAGVPVLYTTVEHPEEDGGIARHFIKKCPSLLTLRPGSHASAIDARIAPAPGEPVVVKRFASGFHGSDLAERLTALGVDTVVVTGVSTSGCVRATVLDALQSGFRPILVEDAVADRDPEAAAASIFDIRAKYGDVLSAEAVITHFHSIDPQPEGSTR